MIDKMAWLYIKDKKVLSTLSKGKDVYYVPGGKREEFENDIEALTREIREELSVDIIVDTVRYYGAFSAQAHGKAEGIIVKISCYMGEYVGELRPSSEIDEMVWLKYEYVDKVSPVDKILFKNLYEKGLID